MMYKVGREFPFQLYIGLYSIKELFVVFIKIFPTSIFTSTIPFVYFRVARIKIQSSLFIEFLRIEKIRCIPMLLRSFTDTY